jgi:maltose/moltooligosaccharide transporter
MNDTPTSLRLRQIWNLSFGFLGIQFGWGLQNANMSAIYEYLGAKSTDIPMLWLAAPLTGLLVQPIVGHMSDRTWTRLGRRRPYFLGGAILASLALVLMPNSTSLLMAAVLLWILDASVNISMEPFRAFVGDLVPPAQRKIGFSMQSLLIGLGAVLSSALPWLLRNVFHVGQNTEHNVIPATVRIAFYIGAVVFLAAVLYTIVTTREKPPADLEKFKRERAASSGFAAALSEIFSGILHMPRTMRALAPMQFFTWLGLFCMWIYFAPALARHVFHGLPGSPEYQEGIEWAGICFSTYNGVAFAASFGLIALSKRFSAKSLHTVLLLCGALGLLTAFVWSDPKYVLISMCGVGVAWASILAMPYAMLANGLPPARMGFYMGLFNMFIVLPQILAATVLGPITEKLLGGAPHLVVLMGGASLLIAALSLLLVRDVESPAAQV